MFFFENYDESNVSCNFFDIFSANFVLMGEGGNGNPDATIC